MSLYFFDYFSGRFLSTSISGARWSGVGRHASIRSSVSFFGDRLHHTIHYYIYPRYFPNFGTLALQPRNASRRLYVLNADIDVVGMSQPTSNNKIVAWNFQLKFRLYMHRLWKFDSRSSVRKVDNRASQPPSITQHDDSGFKDRSSSELATFGRLFYRQGILVQSVFPKTIA